MMPNLNVEVSEELLKAIRVRCAEEGVLQKDWVPEVLGWAVQRKPEKEGCRVEVGKDGEVRLVGRERLKELGLRDGGVGGVR